MDDIIENRMIMSGIAVFGILVLFAKGWLFGTNAMDLILVASMGTVFGIQFCQS